MKRVLRTVLVVALMAGGGFGIARLRQNTVKLEKEAAASRRNGRVLEDQREENRRLQKLLEQTESADAGAVRAVRLELVQARGEVAELERRAHQKRSHAREQALAADTNRDPEKGPTRLAHFQNIGRATPSAAFQTLVWASVNGHDDTLARMIAVTGAAREKAEAVLAGLADEGRQRYSTPEKLAALFFTAELLAKSSALQVTGHTRDDSGQVTLVVRAGAGAGEVKLPMRVTAEGWQMLVSERQIEGIQRQLRGESESRPGK